MKKYFLNIVGLTTIMTPLVAMMSCGKGKIKIKDKEDKGTTNKSLSLVKIKDMFKNVPSTKTKEQINIHIGNSGTKAIEATDIGYNPPSGIPNGVAITYELKKGWGNGDKAETFEVRVTLKKGTETAIKDIIVTAAYDFTAAKALIKDTRSTKIKGLILLPDAADKTLKASDIGYNPPDLSTTGGVSIAKYELKKGWGNSYKAETFEVRVTLKKGTETAIKDIIVTAAYDFTGAEELIQHATSSKRKGEIRLPDATIVDKTLQASDIGYNPPDLSTDGGVSIVKYELKKGWGNGDKAETFEVRVTLKKGTETAIKDIIVTATNDFTAVKELIKHATSSKRKGEIRLPDATTVDKTLQASDIGYNPPDLSTAGGVSIEKYELKKGWGNGDKAETFEVRVTLKKGTETAAKDIWITATNDFTAAKALIKDTRSTKIKGLILLPDAADKTLEASDIGYNPPDLSTAGGVSIEKYELKKGWGNGYKAETFEVRVTLKKGTKTAAKDIWITAKAFNLKDGIKLFENGIDSEKKKKEISPLPKIGTSLTPDYIGYKTPEFPSDVTVEYKLSETWGPDDSSHTFIIQVFLRRGKTELGTTDIYVSTKVETAKAEPEA